MTSEPNNRPAIKYLLHTSLFTAACALALCLGAERLFLGRIPPIGTPLHWIILGSTLLEYNVHHLFNRAPAGPAWSPVAVQWHWAMSMIGGALCLIALPGLPLDVIIACCALGLASFAYSTPLLPFRYKRRLKDFGLVKIHMLTGVWVAVGTVLPALYWSIPFHMYWIELVVRALLIFPLCIAFDIRDAEPDLALGIHTLPNTLGIKAAYLAINLTLCAFLLGGLIRCVYRDQLYELGAYAVSAAAAYGSIRLARRNPHPYIYLVLIDGVMMLYGVLQLIA